jgi:glycerophosphoryl diester phosphodiesterase
VVERENTLASFLAAKENGVDGVEFDVRRTSDGALIVHHDPLCAGRAISETRQRDLPDYVPTLDDAMAACEGVTVNVEIKNSRNRSETIYDGTGALARQVVRHLQQIGWAERVIISCFDQATCAAVRSFDAEIRLGWAVEKIDLAGALTQAHILGFTAVHPQFRGLNAQVMAWARELDLDINTWTVNSRNGLTSVAVLGVNGIITDDPLRARAIIAEASLD